MFTTLISLALENLLYLALHIEGISSFPKPLSAADEKKYFDLYENGDINARNTLIEHNLRLVAHIVKKYYTVTNEQDDLISIGTIGLIKAVNTFSYDKGTRFATYASRCIENQILMHFRTAKKTTCSRIQSHSQRRRLQCRQNQPKSLLHRRSLHHSRPPHPG